VFGRSPFRILAEISARWTEICVVFLGPSSQSPRPYLKLGFDYYLLQYLHLITH